MSEFLLVILLLMLILCMGLPVAFSLGATSVALIFLFGLPLKVVGATMFSSLDRRYSPLCGVRLQTISSITIESDNSIVVEDNGRGMPVDA